MSGTALKTVPLSPLTRKVVLLSTAAADLASLAISFVFQQVAHRNSMEYRIKEAMKEEGAKYEARCDDYREIKAKNPGWEPVGDYYDHCK